MSEQPAKYNVGESIGDELARYGGQFDRLLDDHENLIGVDEADLLRIVAGRAAAQAIANQWVSVNDRQPEDDGARFVLRDGRSGGALFKDVAAYEDGVWSERHDYHPLAHNDTYPVVMWLDAALPVNGGVKGDL
jgi:hypothetical protein